MELKLNIYKDRFCRTVDKTVTADTFDLSVGICEDVLDMVNIDMFEGGLDSLTDEGATELLIGVIKNAFPFFVELIKELFDLTADEVRHTKVEEIARVVMEIVKYSFAQLASSLGGTKTKN